MNKDTYPNVPNTVSQVKINQRYLYEPERYYSPADKMRSWWLLSIGASGDDIVLRQETLYGGELVLERKYSYEDIFARVNSSGASKGMAASDTRIFRFFLEVILVYREHVAKKVFREYDIPYNPTTRNGFKCYIPKKRISLPHPMIQYDIDCNWKFSILHKVFIRQTQPDAKGSMQSLNEWKDTATQLWRVKWSDEAGIRKVVNLFVDNSKWRELEIQAALMGSESKSST